MPTDVIMPVLGMSQDTGKIVSWLKAEGEKVRAGEMLLEIETDKAVAEIEAPADGVLAQILTQVGEEVPVTQVIAIILSEEEYAQQPFWVKKTMAEPMPVSAPVADGSKPITSSPVAARIAAEHKIDLKDIKPDGGRIQKDDVLQYISKLNADGGTIGNSGRELASPKARRLAKESDIVLSQVSGSGPGGAVVAKDIQTAVASSLSVSDRTSQEPILDTQKTFKEQIKPGTIWQRMVEHTTNSWQTAPHFYLQRHVNASRLLDWHAKVKENSTEKITITDLLVLVVAKALTKHPRLNAVWKDDQISIAGDLNIGLAVAIDDGLVVPVIHQADKLRPQEIASKRKELVDRARAGKLRPDDISGGTFTISNLGMFGVDAFTAVLNGPQAAILAVGRVSDQVVPVNGQVCVQPMVTLTVSYDHRVVDGARGARFLETLAEFIEEPTHLIGI